MGGTHQGAAVGGTHQGAAVGAHTRARPWGHTPGRGRGGTHQGAAMGAHTRVIYLCRMTSGSRLKKIADSSRNVMGKKGKLTVK